MATRVHSVFILTLILLFVLGCGRDNPVSVTPQTSDLNSAPSVISGHVSWGLWEFVCDPVTGSIETIPLRSADFNANVVKFLQPPIAPVNMLSAVVQPESDIFNGLWVIDVQIRHPFISMAIFRGFDVRGIVMADGAVQGMHDPGILYHAPDGTRLLNPDGYSRWWNQVEFTSVGTIFGYTEGNRAVPGYESTSTINPYKVFADDLEAEENVYGLDPNYRATFSLMPGLNKRRYKIQFDMSGDPPIRFKYAVDASWALPNPDFAPEYPLEAFIPSANCREAYILSVSKFEEIPYYVDPDTNGGKAVIDITVGDWQAWSPQSVLDQLSHIWIESPTMLTQPIDVLPNAEIIGTVQATQAPLRLTVPNCHPTGLTDQFFLITAESKSPDSYMPQIEGDPSGFVWPDAPLAVYQIVEVPISNEPPQVETGWVVGLPDWCSLTEHCTNGADNLQFMTNLVQWDLDGFFNDELKVKWWEGHLTPTPPYSTSIIQNHIQSLGYTFERTNEPEFTPDGCRMIIIVFVKSPNGGYLPFTQTEADRMKFFVQNGGILCVLIENPNYFDPVEFDPLMDMLQAPLGFGGYAEPPSDTTVTFEITPHLLTTDVSNWQYWTCGEFTLESNDCISLVRSPTQEHIVVMAPIPLD